MKLRRAKKESGLHVELSAPQGWISVTKVLTRMGFPDGPAATRLSGDIVALLGAEPDLLQRLTSAAADLDPETTPDSAVVIPFEPRSFRDFMLYEAHAIAAARGFVNAFMPGAARIVLAYEALTGLVFPKLKPKPLWYRQPIYYMGNPLTVVTAGDAIAVPSYTQALDYELELGFVLAHPLRDASPEAAEAAIGGFVVLNDFSARDVQADEMDSGFGPQKSKHFASAISKVVVSADEVLPRWRQLKGSVHLNGALIAQTSTAGAKWSLGELIAHASCGEQLYRGELFGSGTLPGGSGIETGHLLKSGDAIEIKIEGVGTLFNRVV
jgi:2-keto-4-pentenoate hydratase/2-oxohepta-3-ene-1,7-dioic acid hydratase in catechol pathway